MQLKTIILLDSWSVWMNTKLPIKMKNTKFKEIAYSSLEK